jgi:hypothetical protein
MARRPSSQNDFPLSDDAKFMLGEISAIVKTLPSRMDKFEQKMDNAVISLDNRVAHLEELNANRSGSVNTVQRIGTYVWAFISATVSGFLVWFLGRHS